MAYWISHVECPICGLQIIHTNALPYSDPKYKFKDEYQDARKIPVIEELKEGDIFKIKHNVFKVTDQRDSERVFCERFGCGVVGFLKGTEVCPI